MSIVTVKTAGKALIKIQGEFDPPKCLSFKDELLQLINDGINEVTVNLAEVDFIDSPGIGVLISAAIKLKKLDGGLIIEDAQFHVLDLMEATQINKHLEIKNSQ